MALNRGGKPILIEQAMIDRLNRVGGVDQVEAQGFFGSGQPVQPSAPPEVRGRLADYPNYYNVAITPRADQQTSISFSTLRTISDPAQGGLDILALVIESIKDQIAGSNWNIKGRDGTDGGEKAIAIMNRLKRPDGINPFRTWLRAIIHDHLVIDQPAIYIRPTGGDLPLLDVMDGATLSLKIDAYGRTPIPPYTAYQQVIKGIPAIDYTTDEIILPIYNRRSNRVYGYSRVESVVNIINLALRRQLSQIEYYTSGSVPDMLLGVPETWSVDQISQYQEWFDSILSGNSGDRRKARFIPGGVTPHQTKEAIIKDNLDEWLARVVSYAFSISPDWAVAQVNKATAEVQKQTAMEQGVVPIKLWLSDVMDLVLEKAFDAPELDFQWVEDGSVDPKQQAEILNLYVNGVNQILTVNEARAELGLDPLAEEEYSVALNTPPLPLEATTKKKRAFESRIFLI